MFNLRNNFWFQTLLHQFALWWRGIDDLESTQVVISQLGPLLLTWFNFNPTMDK